MSEWGEAEVNRIFQEQDAQAVLNALEDSRRLERLLSSRRLRFALAIDYQVCLSTCRDGDGRYVIDEVLKHIDKWGNPAGDWFDNLPKAEEKTLWPKEEPHERVDEH